ncbi:MAG: IclR family transcriptional regulator [Clostridia bacterium]|jgi:DNA-binding IclR family transcriptional regulator|nr:IclR family transcriptional regulator [Clostridia bacterium]
MANTQGVTVQSVIKAFNVLECFENKKELGISDISKQMGISKSTIYGIVNTLVETGLLEQDGESKKYRLGLKLFEFGRIVEKRMDLRDEAKPFCIELSEKYVQTVHLATHSEGEVVYIDKFDVPDFLIVYSQVGRRAPMTCTGVGKAMLAYLGKDYIEKYIIPKGFPKKTEKSIDTAEKLYADLEDVRKRGYAIDNEEIEQGLKCIAVPIFDKNGKPVAAVSLSGMAAKMEKNSTSAIAGDVIKCADEISARLGYKRGNS